MVGNPSSPPWLNYRRLPEGYLRIWRHLCIDRDHPRPAASRRHARAIAGWPGFRGPCESDPTDGEPPGLDVTKTSPFHGPPSTREPSCRSSELTAGRLSCAHHQGKFQPGSHGSPIGPISPRKSQAVPSGSRGAPLQIAVPSVAFVPSVPGCPISAPFDSTQPHRPSVGLASVGSREEW
jgi:hypothetical protein